jgi:hypothetical protein
MHCNEHGGLSAGASAEPEQAVLNRYAIERFLYRLGASDPVDEFILKGAMLFVASEDAEYDGVRVKLAASLDPAGIRMQIDICFGGGSGAHGQRRFRQFAAPARRAT